MIQTEGELMKAHAERMKLRARSRRQKRWMTWAWLSVFLLCSGSAGVLWLKDRISTKDAPKRPVSVSRTAVLPQVSQVASVPTTAADRPVLVQSTPITGRLISTTGAAGYGADAAATASRATDTSPIVVGGAASAAPAATGGPVMYRVVGATSVPQPQPSAVATVPSGSDLVPGAVLKAATSLPSLGGSATTPSNLASAKPITPHQALSAPPAAPTPAPPRRAEPLQVDTPPPRQVKQQESDQASGVLLNDDPSQAGGDDGKPMKLIAIVNPLTVVVPDGRGIPRSFEVGGRLPNGTVLRAVDPKQGCAITDRGQFCLK